MGLRKDRNLPSEIPLESKSPKDDLTIEHAGFPMAFPVPGKFFTYELSDPPRDSFSLLPVTLLAAATAHV